MNIFRKRGTFRTLLFSAFEECAMSYKRDTPRSRVNITRERKREKENERMNRLININRNVKSLLTYISIQKNTERKKSNNSIRRGCSCSFFLFSFSFFFLSWYHGHRNETVWFVYRMKKYNRSIAKLLFLSILKY